MSSELVVDVQPKEVSIALLNDKRLVELQKEPCNISFALGDIYLGKVKKLMPGLNAAFVDIGYEKDAFLHYQDLGPFFTTSAKFTKQSLSDRKHTLSLPKFKLQKELDKEGVISDLLSVGQEILVQITKEPISTKGPRLTAELSFAGRFLVLIPFADKVSVSQKIKSNEEKTRLRQLIHSIKPQNFGVIVRTVAEGKRVAELDNEMKTLVKRWEDSLAKLQKAKAPSLIYEETGRAVGLLRDIFNPSFENIYVNDPETFQHIHDYVNIIAPECKDIVKLYTDDIPIFDHFAITKQIKSSFGKTISFRNGAYLIIEHTEALHVIDVNSGQPLQTQCRPGKHRLRGKHGRRRRDSPPTAVARYGRHHRHRLHRHGQCREPAETLRTHERADGERPGPAQHIAAQQVRPHADYPPPCAPCPRHHDRRRLPRMQRQSKIPPSILFTDHLETKIAFLVKKFKVKKFSLHVHPYIAAYITQGFFSLLWRWKNKYTRRFKLIPNQSLALLEYKIYDGEGQEIDLKEEIEIK